MPSEYQKTTGVNFILTLCLIFITLKLTGFIHWSWLWVLSPLWILVLLWCLVFAVTVWYLTSRSNKL